MGDIILDCVGDPNGIVKVLIKENQESLCQRKRFEDESKGQNDMMKKP